MVTDAGRVVLITGSNKGIGYEAARQLGENGMHILIGARDPQRGLDAADRLAQDGISARSVTIDVSDSTSIAQALADIEAIEGQLDVLVNNAGIGLEQTLPSQLDIATLRATMETNFFGAFSTTKAFLPLIKAAPAGRIVNVSSSLGSLLHLSDPQWVGSGRLYPAYSMSKTALNALTALVSIELHGTDAKINSVEPGFTKTDMTGGQGFQTAADAARVIVKYATIGADGPNGGYFDINGRLPW